MSKRKYSEQKAEYEKETSVLKAQIADFQEKRLDFQPKIHPDLISRYQEWFKRQGTGLVSLVVDHAWRELSPQNSASDVAAGS